ncbi:MAG: carbonic anhydrase [Richelia sp. RM2_1_2]|nr:carbonic anhydrase [Richelia sp. SM2_1_7]NJM18307.1 carbonic anhydrase [Richelia sp. SM1_7_0]NJN08373.1 carbonic anhydrase [Richelia sp. RM1_1_1]NJO26916.1 carbonic anhydrase [Richelia sp. SL_2_1]NJO62149.1 carbonic anhydrase [Richelia sp. RM2_1_2]
MNNVIALENIHVHTNVRTSFNDDEIKPKIDSTAYIHPLGAVIGNVHLGKRVMVAPAASVRGDEGQPIYVGDDVNVQDCVVLHALETHVNGKLVREAVVEVEGEFYGVYISERVSLAHQCQVHGPAFIGADTFVGMQALVFRASVGKNCVIEPQALVMGVTIPDGKYVSAGALITTQEAANNLPSITDTYPLRSLNNAVVHVNTELATSYHNKECHELGLSDACVIY